MKTWRLDYQKKYRQSGQSLVEYVMLLTIIVGMGRLVAGPLPAILRRLEEPMKDAFARTYKYGAPNSCGYENDPPACGGSPEHHPRYPISGSARMFARGK